MIGHLGRLVGEYGYYLVAAFIFFEGIAIPFPTDTTIVTAAAFAARGRLSLAIVFLISTLAATAGTSIAFLLGRRGGDFFEHHSKKLNPAVLARTRSFFDRHGSTAVFVGRFIPFARMIISPLAGVSTMSFARFTVFNGAGAAVWSAVFCGIGYFFGQHPPAVGHSLVRGALIVAVGLALIVTVAVAGGWLVEESDAAWRAEGTVWHRILMSAPVRMLAARSPHLRAFLFRRFTPSDYLGLNLTIGLGMSFVALVIFGAITNSLLSHDAVPQFDLDLAAALRSSATPTALAFWDSLSRLGRTELVVLPGLLLSGWSGWRGRTWLPIVGFGGAMIGTALLDLAVKHYFVHRHVAQAAGVAAELGTPSGQALASVVGYGLVAYFLILMVRGHRVQVSITTLAVILVAAINFGRLYAGTRYFSDVVSGLAAGGVWLSACLTGLEVARRRSAFASRKSTGDVDLAVT